MSYTIKDSTGTTLTVVSQNPGGSVLPQSVPSDASGNVLLGQKTMAGSIPVAIASDQTGIAVSGTIAATQSGTWTVQPGNTANTTPWLTTINQGGNSAAVTGANALKVDASATTQPVSGTITANQGGAPWSANITQFGGNAIVTGTGVSGSGIPRVTVSSDSFPATQTISGTVTANQGGAPWTMKPDGSVWTLTGTSANVNVTNATLAVTQSAGPWTNNVTQFGGNNVVTSTGASGVGIPRVTVSNDSNILATQSGPWTTGRTWTLASGTDSVAVSNLPTTQVVSHNGVAQPVYLDDQNNNLDDDGNQYVNTNVPGADIATGANQLAQTAVLQQIAAGHPVTQQGAWSINVASQPAVTLPPNAAQETTGQLQRIADLMEALLMEVRTHTFILANLNQPVSEDPDRIRADLNLSLQ
jgi:hypothetical protein